MTIFPIYPAPEDMMSQDPTGFKQKYPWDKLKVGQAFQVQAGTVKLATLQSLCYKMSKKFKRTFRVKDYGENGFAVARLPDQVANVGIVAPTVEMPNGWSKGSDTE